MTTHKWITADSFECLPSMADNSVQCILTDVPYDFTQNQKLFLHSRFQRIASGIIIVFSPPENQWVHPADQYGFWVKSVSTKNTIKNYSRFVEMIFFYGRNVWNCERHWSQYTNIFTDLVDEYKHPHRKPPSLIERLIRNHTNPGDTVLDPFAGSGVTRKVCMDLGRNSVSIEISGNYKFPTLIYV